MSEPLVIAARELLAEWAEAKGDEALLPYASFVRALDRLPDGERAELVAIGRTVLASAPDGPAKLAALDRLGGQHPLGEQHP